MYYNYRVEFSDWITQRYIDWRGDAIGRERTIKDYSDHIGVAQPIVTRWMSGENQPSSRHLKKVADTVDYGVYDILDIPQDERPVRKDIRDLINSIPEDNQEELRDLIEAYLTKHGWDRIA